MAALSPRDLGQSALSAFRDDLPSGGRPLTPVDDQLLTVATLLRQATLDLGGEQSRRLLAHASGLAVRAVGPDRIAQGCAGEDPGNESPLDVFRLASELCDDRWMPRLGGHILESLAVLAPPDSLVAGRIEIRQLRRLSLAGEHDVTNARIDALLASPAARFDEIRIRGLGHRLLVAFVRGNFPRARELGEEALGQIGPDFPQLRAMTLDLIAIVHAMKGEFSEALAYDWAAYQEVAGRGTAVERHVLANLAILLLDAGYPAQARPLIATLLNGAGGSFAFTLIGGWTEASSKLDDREGVEWGVAQTLRLTERALDARHSAQALFESALALARIGERERSEALMARTLEIAERHELHDLSFRAALAPEMKPKADLDAEATAIASRVEHLTAGIRPESLEHV